MLLYATFGDVYWLKETDPNCVPFDAELQEKLGLFPEITIYTMLAISVILNIICWKWREASAVLFFIECGQILLESLVPHPASRTMLIVVVRFTAATILLSTESRSSIAVATIGALCTQIVSH